MRRDDPPPFNFDTLSYTSITYILLLFSKECNEFKETLQEMSVD